MYRLDQWIDAKAASIKRNHYYDSYSLSHQLEKLEKFKKMAHAELDARAASAKMIVKDIRAALAYCLKFIEDDFTSFGAETIEAFETFAAGVLAQYAADSQANHDAFVEASEHEAHAFVYFLNELVQKFEAAISKRLY